MLRTRTYLSASTSALHCVTFPALPKLHSDAEGGPLNPPQSLVIMLAIQFFFLFVQQRVIVICSHPRPLQYIASICRFVCSPYQHASASDPFVHSVKCFRFALKKKYMYVWMLGRLRPKGIHCHGFQIRYGTHSTGIAFHIFRPQYKHSQYLCFPK